MEHIIHYLYKITNQLNNKIYIGQSIAPNKRWSHHKSDAKNEKPTQYIHRAMIKYGIDNFIFEIIASCKTQEGADEIESILIIQYDSRNITFGYNIKPGGNVSSPSEETKQKMREATLNQIATQGHPAAGRIVSEEEKELHRKARLDKPLEYTPELRQKMSEAHLGSKDSEETKGNKAASAKSAWEKRQAISLASGELKCNALDCDREGLKHKYHIINNIRYCAMHALRFKRAAKKNIINNKGVSITTHIID